MSLTDLASELKSGSISIAEWESAMRDYLREQYRIAVELVCGGDGIITQADWGYEGYLLRQQYEYLHNFAFEIQANPEAWNSARLDARMNLYSESAYTAMADLQAREARLQGFTEETNELGAADHCAGCLTETSRGWVAIGELVPIGDRDCIVKCKCTVRYRREEADSSYTER